MKEGRNEGEREIHREEQWNSPMHIRVGKPFRRSLLLPLLLSLSPAMLGFKATSFDISL